jgi:hypothetical protein
VLRCFDYDSRVVWPGLEEGDGAFGQGGYEQVVKGMKDRIHKFALAVQELDRALPWQCLDVLLTSCMRMCDHLRQLCQTKLLRLSDAAQALASALECQCRLSNGDDDTARLAQLEEILFKINKEAASQLLEELWHKSMVHHHQPGGAFCSAVKVLAHKFAEAHPDFQEKIAQLETKKTLLISEGKRLALRKEVARLKKKMAILVKRGKNVMPGSREFLALRREDAETREALTASYDALIEIRKAKGDQ